VNVVDHAHLERLGCRGGHGQTLLYKTLTEGAVELKDKTAGLRQHFGLNMLRLFLCMIHYECALLNILCTASGCIPATSIALPLYLSHPYLTTDSKTSHNNGQGLLLSVSRLTGVCHTHHPRVPAIRPEDPISMRMSGNTA
jgi:hypothetical protein